MIYIAWDAPQDKHHQSKVVNNRWSPTYILACIPTQQQKTVYTDTWAYMLAILVPGWWYIMVWTSRIQETWYHINPWTSLYVVYNGSGASGHLSAASCAYRHNKKTTDTNTFETRVLTFHVNKFAAMGLCICLIFYKHHMRYHISAINQALVL